MLTQVVTNFQSMDRGQVAAMLLMSAFITSVLLAMIEPFLPKPKGRKA